MGPSARCDNSTRAPYSAKSAAAGRRRRRRAGDGGGGPGDPDIDASANSDVSTSTRCELGRDSTSNRCQHPRPVAHSLRSTTHTSPRQRTSRWQPLGLRRSDQTRTTAEPELGRSLTYAHARWAPRSLCTYPHWSDPCRLRRPWAAVRRWSAADQPARGTARWRCQEARGNPVTYQLSAAVSGPCRRSAIWRKETE